MDDLILNLQLDLSVEPYDPVTELLAAAALESEWVRGAGWSAPGRTAEARRAWFLSELLYGAQHPEDTLQTAADLATGDDLKPGRMICDTLWAALEERLLTYGAVCERNNIQPSEELRRAYLDVMLTPPD